MFRGYIALMGSSATEIALALVEKRGCWLVDRRCGDDAFDGLWEFPGGKIRPGETAVDAALRECAEEVGLVVDPIQALDPIDHAYDDVLLRFHPIVCRWVSGQAAPRVDDVSDVRWVRAEELGTLPMPGANSRILQALLRWSKEHPV